MSYYRDKPGSYRGMGGRGGGNNFNNHQAQNANFGGRQPQRNLGGYGYDSPRNLNFDDRRNYPGPAFDQPPFRSNHNSSNHFDDYDPRDRDTRGMNGGQWDRDHRRPGPPHTNDSMRGNANPASLLPNPPAGNSNNILALSLISSLLQQQQGLPQLLDRPHGPQQLHNNRSAGNMPYNAGPGERRPMNRGFQEDHGPSPKMPRMDEGFKTPSGRGRNSERGRGRGRERSRSATSASPSTSLPRRLATPPVSQPRTTPNSAPPAAKGKGQGRGGKKKGRGRKITYTPAPSASNTAHAASTAATAPQTEGQAGSETQAAPKAEAAATPAQGQESTTTGTENNQTSGDTPAPPAEDKATEGDKTLESKFDATREESKGTELTEEKVEEKEGAEVSQKTGDDELKSPGSTSATNTRKKGDKDSTPYGGLPKELLYCHVCTKHMRDGTSFTNHLGGRAHQLLMKKLEESYELRGNLIRHYVAMEEQRRNVELDRLYRLGKAHNIQQDFCAMCNLKFFGNVSIHRKTPLHQALKRFLHPTCNVCKKEFSNRVDRDFHKLTAEHLKVVASLEGKIVKNTEDEVEDFGSLLEFLSSCKDEPSDLSESAIFGDYNPEEPIGQTMVKRVDAFYCRVCRVILPSEAETGAHCRTKAHYDNYSTAVKQAVEGKKTFPTAEPSQVEQKEESTAVAEEPTPAPQTETATDTVDEVKEAQENGSEAPAAAEVKMEVDKPEEKTEDQKAEENIPEVPVTEAN